MAKLIELQTNKTGAGHTYATRENAIRAVNKKFSDTDAEYAQLRYILMQDTDGRWFPVFVGQLALRCGVHFHFHVLG